MQTSKNERMLAPSVAVEIAPAYQNAIAQTASHYKVMVAFVKAQMKRDIDYGVIPGTKKPTLLKPGAEKREQSEKVGFLQAIAKQARRF